MRPFILPLTAALLLSPGGLLAQDHPTPPLASARNALAEALPDVAAARVERYLQAHKGLAPAERATAHLLLGECYLRAGEVQKALTTLQKVPSSHLSQKSYWEGLALAAQEKLEPAIAKLAQVASQDPLYPQALLNRTELHSRQKQWTQAFETLAALRTHSPDFQPQTLAQIEAQLFLATGEPAKAATVLSTVAKSDQQETKAALSQLIQGRIALAQTDYPAAQTAFQKALELNNSHSLQALALLGQSDTLLQGPSPTTAATPLLTLLRETTAETTLPLQVLHDRFDTLLTHLVDTEALQNNLKEFASPSTLGEDSNYATPPKLFACYYLARISTLPEAQAYLSQIITLSPNSSLAARAHFQRAQFALEKENSEDAESALKKVIAISGPSSPLASQAADLLARLANSQEDLAKARDLFVQAAGHPHPLFSEQALLNQALLKLTLRPDSDLSSILNALPSENSQTLLDLERCLALAAQQSDGALDALLQFLSEHPSHPRIGEIRLALAQLTLTFPEPNYELVETQLAALPENLDQKLSRESFHVAHLLGITSSDWGQAVAAGEKHRKRFPESEEDPFFLLRLAESSFQNGDYNRARFLFSEVSNLPQAGELRELSQLYAARANLLIPTREATIEALDTLDQVIAQGGPLANRARLLKARTLLKSLGQATECLTTLDGIPGQPGDQPEAALLAAQAYRELAANDPQSAGLAISIYERLLADSRTSYPLSNRIHYQLALTHRESGKLNLAIEPCLRVVDFENRPPDNREQEWDYYYRCGFEAIDILLQAKRPQAALILARKLSQTNGPRAQQAKERAEQIQLDHLLWAE